MKRPDRVIEACHWQRRYAVDSHGTVGKITAFFDRRAEETDDWREAVTAVVHWPDDDTWSSIDMAAYQQTLFN